MAQAREFAYGLTPRARLQTINHLMRASIGRDGFVSLNGPLRWRPAASESLRVTRFLLRTGSRFAGDATSHQGEVSTPGLRAT